MLRNPGQSLEGFRLGAMTDHYFSSDPQSPARLGVVEVNLRGHHYSVAVASGTFSPGGLDRGTAVLLAHAPTPPLTGVLVDVGCGWGPVTLALAKNAPDSTVLAVDTNPRARELTSRNAASAGAGNVQVMSPEEVPDSLVVDCVWSNPPIRIGKKALHELLAGWLYRLSPTGQAWLVVAKHLGAESLTRWLNTDLDGAFVATRYARDKGYHVIKVTRN